MWIVQARGPRYAAGRAPPSGIVRLYPSGMSRIFRLAIDEDTLTDELFAFVCDPRSSRYERRVVRELRALAPGMIPVMEMMILDGVQERVHVADYVHAVVGDGADGDVYYVT